MLAAIIGLANCAGVTASPGNSESGGATLTINPPSIAFGSVVVGSTGSQAVIVSNTGTTAITFQAVISGQEFSISGLSGSSATIAAGQQGTFTVAFNPTSAGAATGNVSITSAALPSGLSVALSGTGVAANGQLSASPTSVNFGNVVATTTSIQNVTVENTGNVNIVISGVSISGSGFNATGIGPNVTLAPNQSATLAISFDPATAGSAVTGAVSIASNASNSPLQVSVSGTGIQASQHTVTLNWQASTSSVVGYFVYRGTQASGPYAKLNPSAVDANTSYVDNLVGSGQTYYYVVTSVASNNEESTYSNQVSAAIPNP